MPAGRLFSRIIFIGLVLSIINACSRDNPLNVPEPYVEPVVPACIENGPYSYYGILEDIEISNIVDALPDDFPREWHDRTLEIVAPYLTNSSIIKPVNTLESFLRFNDDDSEPETLFIVRDKTLDPLARNILSIGEQEFLNQSTPLIANLLIKVQSSSEGEDLTFIDEEVEFVEAELNYGVNSIKIFVSATIEVPRTFRDCVNPLTSAEVDDPSFNESDRIKKISYEQTFTINITRNSASEFLESVLDPILLGSSEDELGKIIALNDRFVVLGVPGEDTLAKGVFTMPALMSENEDAIDSGAAYIFAKDDTDSWALHTVLKSSNSEAGDLFGSAVTIDDNRLVISALGESSFASGVFLSSDELTANIKLNNTAQSSGAVYVYQYSELDDSWSEIYYIKPNENVVSDGDFNKGFGTKLLLNGGNLIISAPLEDSDNGDPDNGSQPNSGAVYVYRYQNNQEPVFINALKAYNPGEEDKFGSSISLRENFLAVAAPFEDHGNRKITNNITDLVFEEDSPFENNQREDSGAVYIFEKDNLSNLFEVRAHIKTTNSDQNDYFGSSIKLVEERLIVGAIGEDGSGQGFNRDLHLNNLPDSGAAYIFDYNSTSGLWTEALYIKAQDSQAGANFGRHISADLENLFISAPLHDSASFQDEGKVYYYTTKNKLVNLISSQLGSSTIGTVNPQGMRYGSTIATSGPTLAVGASAFIREDSGLQEQLAGRVFIYE